MNRSDRDSPSNPLERALSLTNIDAELIGEPLGKYRVGRPIGAGGMGRVFRAHHPDFGVVVMKFLRSRSGGHALPEERRRFQRELALMQELRLDKVVQTLDHGEHLGIPFLTMPLVLGWSVDELLRQAGSLPWELAVELSTSLFEGLAELHEQGVIHRDIKPSNVMIDAAGGAVLIDLGIARKRDLESTSGADHKLLSTLAYTSPEQISSRALCERADLFSAGASLYTLLTGDHPFLSETAASTIYRLLTHDPAPLSGDVPAELSELCLELLAKDPARRPAGAAAVVDRCRAISTAPRREQKAALIHWLEAHCGPLPTLSVGPPFALVREDLWDGNHLDTSSGTAPERSMPRAPRSDEYYSFGRTEETSLTLPWHTVSRRHAAFVGNGESGETYLRDLGSTNGTTRNGEPVDGAIRLYGGDIIGFGPPPGYAFVPGALLRAAGS